ncbi:MAG: HDOD domain-containing protein [Piscirickettsiaceae bacterium]|nr:HDOD domain-containing protein [Piscirickettsiaceae bacterium]
MSQNNHKVTNWIEQLSDEDMPGFAGTVMGVTTAVNDQDTSAADVAQIILRDPSLTSRLLKMANSFFYNPNGQEMSTVSRAVMILGFDKVRALTLSLVLVDSLSNGKHREKLTEEIAQSFHAAVQAQELAKKINCKKPENIFVATLLSRLGNMAFWAFAGDKADALLKLVEAGEMTEQKAEKEVLGFSLKELTQGLSQSWGLGDLLDDSLSDKKKNDPDIMLVNLGGELAQASKSGWDSEETQRVIDEIAKKLDIKSDDVTEIAHTNAKQAKIITKMYGVTAASKQIPQAQYNLIDDEEYTQGDEDLIDVSDIELQKQDVILYPEPDAQVQLSILNDIVQTIEESPSINIILEMVLEGIHRGVGMDRSLFAILSKDRKTLICKYALGTDNEKLCEEFKIDVSLSSNIFHKVIKTKKVAHISADPSKINGTLTRDVFKLLGPPPYLIMPTIVRGKVIGMFLADRNASKRVINEKDLLVFQQFCQQANMGLTFLSMQG